MSVKFAYQADVCYNKHINIVLPERCLQHPQAWTNLSWRFAMDTLPQNTPQKQCSGPCGRILPATLEYFSPDRRNKNGLQARCKRCAVEQHKAYAAKHKEELKLYKAKYRAEHPDYQKNYNAEHREGISK